MEEVGWRGEGRWPIEVKDSSEGRETDTALEFISQDGVCTSVLSVTDGVNFDEPCHLSEPQYPHLFRWDNNIFLVLFEVNEIIHAKDL